MKLKDNQYIIERTGPIRTTRKLSLTDQYAPENVRDEFEKYIKKEIIDELLCEYEGGIEAGEMYVLTYEKRKDKSVEPNCYQYEMRIAPITRVSENDLDF